MESDHPIEYRALLRERPNHSNLHKIFRWRPTNSDDDSIAKVLLMESFPWTQVDTPTVEQIYDKLDNDWTGMDTSVVYSMKKRKRWLLPSAIEENLPEYDTYDMPLELSTVSISRFHRHRPNIALISVGWGFYNISFHTYSLNFYGETIKSFGMRKANGTVFQKKSTQKRGMSKSVIPHLLRNNNGKAPWDEPPKFHLQFQSIELQHVPNKHNSRIFDYDPTKDLGAWKRKPQQFAQAHIVGIEIPATGFLEEEDLAVGLLVNALRLESQEDSSVPPRPGLTLGDFFDVHNIPRKIKKKCDLLDWTIV